MLSNNLINLGLYHNVNNLFKEHGKQLSVIEEIEPEPSLGNGGLGRLAACFLDSCDIRNSPDAELGLTTNGYLNKNLAITCKANNQTLGLKMLGG